MDEYFFNVDNGYLEGLVRGFRSGIMNRADYLNLVQCETIEGMLVGPAEGLGSLASRKWVCLCRTPLVPRPHQEPSSFGSVNVCSVHLVLPLSADLKAQLQATDYGNFLQNEPSPIPVAIIDDKLRSHLVVQFLHIRNQCTQPLAKFLDYIT